MKKTILATTVAMLSFQFAHAQTDYKQGAECAKEAFEYDSEYPSISYCIGNAYDPSEEMERGFDETIAKLKTSENSQKCQMKFAVYIADGSRADQFVLGPVMVSDSKELLLEINRGKEMRFYGFPANELTAKDVNPMFAQKNGQWEYTEFGRKCAKEMDAFEY